MTYRASNPVVRVSFEKEDGQIVEQTFTEPFTIGRAVECQLQLALKSVSRVHARVVFENAQWRVQDAGSTNGLYVDDRKMQEVTVSGPMTLRLGPSGPVLHFSVTYPEPEALKPEEGARALFEPELPAPAPFRPPPPAPLWPEPPVKASVAPPPPVTVLSPDPPFPLEPTVKVAPQEAVPVFPTPYRANRFTFSLSEGWADKTAYILRGPVTDGFQHSITIHVEPEVPVEALLDYADAQMQALKAGLQECRLLKKDQVQLVNGLPAYRVIFVWQPAEDVRLYQEQLYVLHRQTGYTLTATFTRKTRKMLGPQIEQIMVSFTPQG